MCPYCHSTEEQPGYSAFQPHPQPDIWTTYEVDRGNKEAVMANARMFLERAKHDTRLREIFERQFPGLDITTILDSADFYDFSLKLLDLMRKLKRPAEEDIKVSSEDIKKILDKRLRTNFAIQDVPVNKLQAKLQEGEEVKVLNEKYADILNEALALVKPEVDLRGKKTAEDAVKISVEKHLKEIQEMFRSKKEPAPLVIPVEEKPKEGEEDTPIMTPSSLAKAKVGGALLPKIMQLIKSKQKEEVKEFRKIEQGTGKVTWNKTHFIFAMDCSGSMRGRRAKAVEQGFERCVTLLKAMPEIVVSSFTFDDKCTDHIKQMEPTACLKSKTKMPLTFGEKTDYRAALQKVLSIIEKDKAHEEYLQCILFMSDGKGGYPESEVEALAKMKEAGKKMIFITLACETEEDEDMAQMAGKMKGEHYKCTDADAMKTAFMKIIAS
jgi:uncharacterized protein YegL